MPFWVDWLVFVLRFCYNFEHFVPSSERGFSFISMWASLNYVYQKVERRASTTFWGVLRPRSFNAFISFLARSWEEVRNWFNILFSLSCGRSFAGNVCLLHPEARASDWNGRGGCWIGVWPFACHRVRHSSHAWRYASFAAIPPRHKKITEMRGADFSCFSN